MAIYARPSECMTSRFYHSEVKMGVEIGHVLIIHKKKAKPDQLLGGVAFRFQEFKTSCSNTDHEIPKRCLVCDW